MTSSAELLLLREIFVRWGFVELLIIVVNHLLFYNIYRKNGSFMTKRHHQNLPLFGNINMFDLRKEKTIFYLL